MTDRSQPVTLGFGQESPIGRITATNAQRSFGRGPERGYRRLGAYAFVFLLAGSGRYQDERGTDLTVQAGDMILIVPAVGHAYGPETGMEWIERWVVFEGLVFELWERKGLFDSAFPVVHLGDVPLWSSRIDALFADTRTPGLLPALEEVCRMQTFLAEVLRAGNPGTRLTTDDQTWLAAAYVLLDRDDVALNVVADQLALSYDGFRKRFRDLAGVSPGRYRALRTVDRACRMMQTTRMTNREIAERLGFYDEQHFSRRFKQIVGRSPRAFRASIPIASEPRATPCYVNQPPSTGNTTPVTNDASSDSK